MNSTKHSVRWVALETVFSRGLGLLSYVIVARILGPKAIGVIALVVLVKELAELVSDFGLGQAVIHHRSPSQGQLATLYTFNCLFGVLSFLLMSVLAHPISVFFGEPKLNELIPVAALGFLVAPLGQQVNALLQKAMDFRCLAKISIVTSTIGMIIAVGGVSFGLGVWALILSGLVGSIVQQLLLLNVGVRRKILNGFAFKVKEAWPLLTFGIYRTGATVLNLLNSRVDQFVVGRTLGAIDLGLYSMASRWSLMTMQQLNSIATKVAFPAIANIQDDLPRVREAYLKLVNRVCTVNSVIYFGLIAIADLLVDVVLGPGWSDMVIVLQLMCLYVLLRSLGNLNGPLSMGLGKARRAFYWNFALLVLVSGTLIVASGQSDLKTIIWALIGLQFFLVSLMYIYWTRYLIGACLKEYTRAVCLPWVSGVFMAIILIIVKGFFGFQNSIIGVIVLVPVGAFVYLMINIFVNKESIVDICELLNIKL